MHQMNLWAAWIGILLGMLSGAAQGLYFHNADWLGGYASWSRRLARLGHISFFGLAMINLAFALTIDRLIGSDLSAMPSSALWSSYLLIAGAILMPLVCYLAAWRKSLRQLFALPVSTLILGVLMLLLLGAK